MTDKAKFVFTDEITKSIVTHEKNENKRRNSAFNVEVFSPERSTECERKLLYEIYGNKISEGYVSESLNTLRHKWASLMMRMPNVILHGVDVEFADVKYNLSGKVDMVLEFENRSLKAIGTVREIDAEMMAKIRQKGPIRKDVVTDNLYMWMSEIPHAIMIYEDSQNKEIEVFHALPYNAIIATAREKFGRIAEHKIRGTLIDKPYENAETRECQSCEYRTECWKEKT